MTGFLISLLIINILFSILLIIGLITTISQLNNYKDKWERVKPLAKVAVYIYEQQFKVITADLLKVYAEDYAKQGQSRKDVNEY